MLEWPAPVSIKRIVFYTMEDWETQDYVIQYKDQDEWKLFGDANVTDNTESRREYAVDVPVTTQAVRFLGEKGSIKQPSLVRVIQLQVIPP